MTETKNTFSTQTQTQLHLSEYTHTSPCPEIKIAALITSNMLLTNVVNN